MTPEQLNDQKVKEALETLATWADQHEVVGYQKGYRAGLEAAKELAVKHMFVRGNDQWKERKALEDLIAGLESKLKETGA